VITLKPLLFFVILEITAMSIVGCSVLFWKWRALARERRAMMAACQEARRSLESAIASAPGGDDEMRRECLKGLQEMFRETDMIDPSAWSRAGEAIFRALERSRQQMEPAEPAGDSAEDWMPDGEMDDLDDLSSLELQAVMSEQNRKFDELDNYKSALANLSGRFQRTKLVNFKLLEYLRDISAKDEKYEALKLMVEKLQQNDRDLEALVTELEQEKSRLEPQVAMLGTENRKLQKALLHCKKQIENMAPEKIDLQINVKDLEKRLESRNKTYERLHKKFEALRREYIILYERSSKGRSWTGTATARQKDET
jgi:DNA repair exonuclease SbcCD ATPase subunit